MKLLTFINKTFSKNNIYNTQQIFKENKISSIKYKNSYNDFFQLYICKNNNIQEGGDNLINIRISPNKYTFRVDEYDADNEKIFSLIKLDAIANIGKDDFEEDDYCGYMIIDEKNK